MEFDGIEVILSLGSVKKLQKLSQFRLLREMLNEDNWTQTVIDERFHRLRDSYNVFATAVKIPYKSLQVRSNSR